jgi:opacity protein-like surface antigen
MKHIIAIPSLFVSSLLVSSLAFAQISLKGEVMPKPAFNWTGFYAGLNIGAVNHTMKITDTQATSFLATIEQVSNPRLTGGLQLGYRRQLDLSSVSGVYGLEVSANFSNAKFQKEYGSPYALYQLDSKNELKTVGILEAIGGIAADKTLLFIGAGLAWVNISGTTTNLDSIAFFNEFNVSKKEFGTALSGGIEYAFNETLSARVKIDVITPNTYSTHDNVGDKFDISNNIVQGTVGINYKFA